METNKIQSVKERCEWRAKADTDNKWVYGSLDNDKEDFFILVNDLHRHLAISVRTITLGQYTGFKDKNGKKIYEDDIIADSFEEIGVVKWNGFNFLIDYNNNWVADFQDVDFDDVEIIGNIYDNSDLLNK